MLEYILVVLGKEGKISLLDIWQKTATWGGEGTVGWGEVRIYTATNDFLIITLYRLV